MKAAEYKRNLADSGPRCMSAPESRDLRRRGRRSWIACVGTGTGWGRCEVCFVRVGKGQVLG